MADRHLRLIGPRMNGKKTRPETRIEVFVPGRRRRASGAGFRGSAVQTFLDADTREKFDEYLARHRLSVSDCLRWLITYAVANDLKPPEE